MTLPILYSFRRCPYAMRARLGLMVSGTVCELREVKLSAKPPELALASPKATVPVLVLPDGAVIDESIEIMRWALARNDPADWLTRDDQALIAESDGPFKHALDRYKYPEKHASDPEPHRQQGLEFLHDLNSRIALGGQLCGAEPGLADMAIIPFVRQFAATDRAWFAAQDLGSLQGWLENHLQSPLFTSIMGRPKPWQAGDPPLLFAADK